jgi:hypothetical protein
MRKEKKRSNKNTKCNGVWLKNACLRDSQLPTIEVEPKHQKNSFTLVKLGPLHKNGLPSLSVIRVTTHSKTKNEWQHTQERWALQLKKGEHNSSKQFTSRSRSIKSGEWREARLILNKNLTNWMFLSLGLSLTFCIWLVSSLEIKFS